MLLRIIGGEWRGRKVHFPPVAAIRPTPDRVRETVFNWLQSAVAGRRCLDLYAGSGALGLEALSRGAREVVFVDVEPAVVRHLGDVLRELACDPGRSKTVRADARAFLRARVDQRGDRVAERGQHGRVARLDVVGLLRPFLDHP